MRILLSRSSTPLTWESPEAKKPTTCSTPPMLRGALTSTNRYTIINVYSAKTDIQRFLQAMYIYAKQRTAGLPLHPLFCCILPIYLCFYIPLSFSFCFLLLFPHPVMLPGLKEAVQDQTYNTNGKQHINPYAVKAAFRQPPHNEDTHKCQRKQAAPF